MRADGDLRSKYVLGRETGTIKNKDTLPRFAIPPSREGYVWASPGGSWLSPCKGWETEEGVLNPLGL